MEKWSVIKHYRDIIKSESGYIIKNGDIKVALIYPNVYSIAIQNLGFQYVYKKLNEIEGIVCERFVLDFYEDNLSIETQRFLKEFDIIFVSINYEEDVINLVKFLNSQKTEIFAAQRSNYDSPIIAGGALTVMNPKILYDIVDIQLCGDFEPMFKDIEKYLKLYDNKNNFLKKLSKLQYSVSYLKKEKAKVAHKSDKNPVFSIINTKEGKFESDFLIELSVGCKYSCRFCSATYAYRPYRVIKKDNVINSIKENCFSNKIGLISAAFGDLKNLPEYFEFFRNNNYSISVSSLRIDTLDSEKLNELKKLSVRSITIAEEVCSERLKKLIGKEINEERILQTVKEIAAAGMENIKLYFMIGLPFETIGDVELIIKRVENISDIFRKIQKEKFGRIGKIKVSLNIFIPKPLTPMQYFPFTNKKDIERKIKILRKGLGKIPNVKFDIMSYKNGLLQAYLSRAQDEIYDFFNILKNNDYDLKKVLKLFNVEKYASKEYSVNTEFAWEKLLHAGISKQILIREYEKCLKQKTE
jgi:radical SAM superfamily enzyme YgiQ (UPF0313 family)